MTSTVNPVIPMQGTEIPSDYAALGVETGYKPKQPNQLRFYIIGPSGGGKTSFVSSIPRALILDFEDGAWGVPNPRASRIVCKSAEKFDLLHKKLIEDAKNNRRPFDFIVFDTIDQFIEIMGVKLAVEYEVQDITDYGAKGAGWSLLRNACWDRISALERVGYSWIVLGHITEKTITVSNKEKTVTRPVLFDSFSKQIQRNSEMFMMISPVEEMVQQYREVQGRKIATKLEPTIRYYMEATTSAGFATTQTKVRGVPNMSMRIQLPDTFSASPQYGWDVFCLEYNNAVNQIKASQTPALAPAKV